MMASRPSLWALGLEAQAPQQLPTCLQGGALSQQCTWELQARPPPLWPLQGEEEAAATWQAPLGEEMQGSQEAAALLVSLGPMEEVGALKWPLAPTMPQCRAMQA